MKHVIRGVVPQFDPDPPLQMLGLIMAVSCLLLPLSAQPTDIVQGVDSAAPDSPGSPESPGISPAGEDRDAKCKCALTT